MQTKDYEFEQIFILKNQRNCILAEHSSTVYVEKK